MTDYSRRLSQLLVGCPDVVVQNRLITASDRDVALSMLYLKDGDRARMLEKLSAAKQRRIVEELERHEHLQITYAQYESAIRSIIRALEQDSVQQKVHSYVRPRRASRRSS
ncbi:MAG: hypothetical protein ACQETQ_01000 [Spirochaetota bacterium]